MSQNYLTKWCVYVIALLLVLVLTLIVLYEALKNDTEGVRNDETSFQAHLPIAGPKTSKNLILFKQIVYGKASWYDYDLQADNQKCKNNNCYSQRYNTCASRQFENETILFVERIDKLGSTTCRVNDYGPQEETGRIIDLSSKAFKELAPLSYGVIEVIVRSLTN